MTPVDLVAGVLLLISSTRYCFSETLGPDRARFGTAKVRPRDQTLSPGMAFPDPTDFGLAPFPDSVVAVRVPPEGLTLYRLVRSRPADVNQDFRWHSLAWAATGSHSELLRVAFSHYLSIDAAIRFMTKPGSWVAQLSLKPSPLIHIARTNRLAGGTHVSVWAPTDLLFRSIVGYPAGPKGP
jgi:hypothetical protein